MSDLYDSLEDDNDDTKSSRDSLDIQKASGTDTNQGMLDSQSQYSFYLDRNYSRQRLNVFLDPSEINLLNNCESKHFLPKIVDNASQRVSGTPNTVIIDNRVLNQQGLQLNDDGSFTKSPRSEYEELPFITQEYRNLQFQKRKTFQPMKKVQENLAVDKMVQKKIRKEEKPTKIPLKGAKIIHKDNLTDSMKEKLLFNQGNNKTYKKSPQKTKNDLNLQKTNVKNVKTPKDSQRSILKHQSAIFFNAQRPRLNYSERRLIEQGYNPLYLKQWRKKVMSDTDRSNFGDSVADDLSAVSKLAVSSDNVGTEEEELFYKKLMETDQTLRETIQRSSRSEGPLEFKHLHASTKDHAQSKIKNIKLKSPSKSLSIDVTSEPDQSVKSSKKSSHYCSTSSSENLSKAELAKKARTYGYLANARNIFKLKIQSEGKFGESSRNLESSTTRDIGKLLKRNSLPVNGFPKIKAEEPRHIEQQPKASKSLCKAETEVGLKGLVLPKVNNDLIKNSDFQSQVLQRLSCCFRD